MDVYTLNILLNHSIVIAAVAGIARAKYVLKTYYPFLLYLWLALANESASLLLISRQQPNTINSNIYVLCEYLILLYQFYKWKGCQTRRLYFFALLGVAVWLTDNVVINQLSDTNSLFRGYASFVLLFFSIDRMNQLIVYQKGRLLQQATFLICAAFLLFYGCKVFVEVFHLFKLPFSSQFYTCLWLTLAVVNGVSNIIYAIAVLCMPTREEFILPY